MRKSKSLVTELSLSMKGVDSEGELLRHTVLIGPHGSGKTTRLTALALALTHRAPQLALVEDSSDPARLAELVLEGSEGSAIAMASVEGPVAAGPFAWEFSRQGDKQGRVEASPAGSPLPAETFPVAWLEGVLARPGGAAQQELLRLLLSEGAAWPVWLEEACRAAESDGAPSFSANPVEALQALLRRGRLNDPEEDGDEAEESVGLLDSLLARDDLPVLDISTPEGADVPPPEGSPRAPSLREWAETLHTTAYAEGHAAGKAEAELACRAALTDGSVVGDPAPELAEQLAALHRDRDTMVQQRDWLYWALQCAHSLRESKADGDAIRQVWAEAAEAVGDSVFALSFTGLGEALSASVARVEVPPLPSSKLTAQLQAQVTELEAQVARLREQLAAVQNNEHRLENLVQTLGQERATAAEQLHAAAEQIRRAEEQVAYVQKAGQDTVENLEVALAQAHDRLDAQMRAHVRAKHKVCAQIKRLHLGLTALEGAAQHLDLGEEDTARNANENGGEE